MEEEDCRSHLSKTPALPRAEGLVGVTHVRLVVRVAGAGAGAAVATERVLAAREVVVREKPDKTDKGDKTKKAPQQPRVQRIPKRPRWRDATEGPEDAETSLPKRRDRKATVKSAWWRRGGNTAELETELLDAVAILRSLQNSPPCPELLADSLPGVYYAEAAAAAGMAGMLPAKAAQPSRADMVPGEQMRAVTSGSSQRREGEGEGDGDGDGARKTPVHDVTGTLLVPKAEQSEVRHAVMDVRNEAPGADFDTPLTTRRICEPREPVAAGQEDAGELQAGTMNPKQGGLGAGAGTLLVTAAAPVGVL